MNHITLLDETHLWVRTLSDSIYEDYHPSAMAMKPQVYVSMLRSTVSPLLIWRAPLVSLVHLVRSEVPVSPGRARDGGEFSQAAEPSQLKSSGQIGRLSLVQGNCLKSNEQRPPVST
ncbi:hypothetical protein NKH74_32735 [Mesorhizobium sp. M0933]|uniref:hypothetical protein n=1 Tax=Mesorhizobium sp. M0933 TaxID=2957030 RepID=UPI00333C154F